MEENNMIVTVSGNLPGDGSIPPSITAEELRALLIEILFPEGEERTGEGVSGNDAAADRESVSGNDTAGERESISGNDIGGGVSDNSVSGNSVSGNGMLSDIYTEVKLLKHEDVPIWEKPLTDYTPTEGLMLLMFILVLALVAGQIMKGGEKHV